MNPVIKIAAISSEVATGRKINGRDGLTERGAFSRGDHHPPPGGQ